MARRDPGCLPPIRTLRRIRWPFQPRSHDPRAAFRLARESRWMTLSRHPGSSPIRSTVKSPAASDSRHFFTRRARRRFTADDRPELGLRSLPPPPFLERCAGAYLRPNAAYRFLQLFATCGHCDPSSRFLAGTKAATFFLFSTHHAISLARAVARGEPRNVRPPRPRCRLFPLARVFPTAIPLRSRHLRRFPVGVGVTIDVHGPLDRVKDASPLARGARSALASGAHAFLAVSRRRSPPRRPKSTFCRRCVRT